MADTRQIHVVFTPSGKRGSFEKGKTVLQVAQQLGVDLDTICGGRGICDRCQIDHSIGSFAKLKIESLAQNLSALTASELEFFPEDSPPTRRLGCQAKLLGDAVIDIPPASQAHRQVVRKQLDSHSINVNPAIRLYYVEVPEPNMHDPVGDLQRLKVALEFEWGLTGLAIDFHLLPTLQSLLRKGNWRVTVAVHDRNQIIALWSGLKKDIYGVAVDVGSTTIAAHLINLTDGEVVNSVGRMNPQIRFGEDLMSRVSYAMMNPGGEVDMTQAVREAIQALVDETVADNQINVNDVLDMTLVGNPVMHHLLLGMSPVELGGAPFALATDSAVNVRAAELGLTLNAGTRAYILPCIAGHVGADAAAATLAEALYAQDDLTLLVDVGTNAEIVLGNNKRMLAASSPTGPAFEGAQISGGQRAAPGAIERVRINPQTLEPRFRVIGSDIWSDQPDFKEVIKTIGVTGICGSGIIEVIAEMYLSQLIRSDGVIDGQLASRTNRLLQQEKTWSYKLFEQRDLTIVITQNDVRAIQLAKAALYAGARLLMDKLNVDKVEKIRLAGAFGAHIDVKYAMVLGMIPDCQLEKVTAAGNAAGMGATIALLDIQTRHEIEHRVRRIEKIETAVEAKFQEHFIKALAIPHKTDTFAELRKQVALPQPTDNHLQAENRRKTRRGKR